jgi:hypothetical protein
MVEILELFEYSLGFLSVLTVECRTLAVFTISTDPPAQESEQSFTGLGPKEQCSS